MNIFLKELKQNRKSLIIWSLSISVILFLQMTVYPNFAKNQESMQEFLKAYPEGLLAAFGVNRLNLGDILGYFGMEAYLVLTLFGGIYSILLASNMIVKEESDKTIEFLLTKPVSRNEIITQKLFAVLTNLVLFNLVMFFVLFLSFEIYKTDDYDFSLFLLLVLGAFLLQLTFASLGFMLSGFLKKTKTVYPLSIGLVLVTYFLNVIANISGKLEFLKYLSPFKYVDAPDILINEQIDSTYLSFMLLIIILSIGITYFYYRKKDITI